MTRGELIQSVLLSALELPEGDREAYVRVAAPDESVATEVLSLLRFERVAGGSMDPFTTGRLGTDRDAVETLLLSGDAALDDENPAGRKVGGFTLVRELGRGGMGVVYEAEQHHPRRRVALKVLAGLGAPAAVRRRLELEAEVLGRLRHDGIAQIYEAGVAESAQGTRSYFAMELIEGARSATDFADHAALSRAGRLELLARIAEAVGHAHARGVVHRDLKPENVLVTPDGRPKVVDFGIAHVADDATIAATTITHEGQILGTLAYMAPEQLTGDTKRVTARADVYALGVIGFELLAGRRPVELAGLSISAAFRAIDTTDPPRLRDADRSLRGDPETIIERCLSREPERRYADGAELAADIRRHLSNRPILSRPTTRLYRASRFVKRHRGLSIGLGVAAMVLIVGSGVSLAFGVLADRARQIAEQERTIARMKELDAIRGVIRGASMLRGRDESWEAVGQMQTIAHDSRGWEWRHEALKLPWVLDRNSPADGGRPPGRRMWRPFVTDRELLFVHAETQRLWSMNIVTGESRRVPLDIPVLVALIKSEPRRPGEVVVVLEDRRVVHLDIATGAIEPAGYTWPEAKVGEGGLLHGSLDVLTDPPGLVKRGLEGGLTTMTITSEGNPTLVLGEDLITDGYSGPWWERPAYARGSRYMVLGRHANGGEPTRLITIDRHTNTIVAEAPLAVGAPNIAMTRDGAHVVVRGEDGVEMRAVPGLELERSYGGVGEVGLDIIASPADNRVVFVGYSTGRVMIIAPDGTMTEWPEPLDVNSWNNETWFTRDGRLLLARDWVIDTHNPGPPIDRAVTHLRGHASYVYQLAVSPDGTLLASAAPEGGVIVWDLARGRVLARLDRSLTDRWGGLAFNMSAPLVFTPEGGALLFGERSETTGEFGYTRVTLADGSREWTASPHADAVQGDIARAAGARPGQTLSHHGAVLTGGRLLLADASVADGHRLRIRSMEKDADELVLTDTRAEYYAGVGVSPDGRSFVAGEYPYDVRVRDAETGEPVATLEDTLSNRVYGMAYSPDGTRIAIGTEEGRVVIYETEFYKKIADITVPPVNPDAARNYIYALAWTPDGSRLICSGGSVIRVLESERPLVREERALRWSADLDAARRAEPCSPAARRAAAIERWGARGPGEAA